MKTKSFNMGLFYFLGAVLWFAAVEARSDNYKESTLTLDNRGTSSNVNSQALSIAASQIHMDWSTNKLQGGLGTGYHAGSHALSVGIGKRAGKVLINGSISTDGTDTAFGAGINFRF